MKLKQTNALSPDSGAKCTLGTLGLRSCKRILAQIRRAKDAIFTEWRDPLREQERMLQLALTEAEALAWQTDYPHLVFPALASEKVQAVARWNRRQQSLHGTETGLALAA